MAMARATANREEVAVPMHHQALRKKKSSGLQRREALEEEVANLYKLLEYEEKVHSVLERAFHGHVTSIPTFLPSKMKELLAELLVVEEEIAELESKISKLQQNYGDEQINSPEASKFKQRNQEVKEAKLITQDYQSPPRPPKHEWVQQTHASEARALFFINQAIKGNYSLNGFARYDKLESSDEKERQREVGFPERISRKSGILERPLSVPRLPPKHPRSKTAEPDSEISFSMLRSALSDSTPAASEEMGNQRWQPNKLSESIMKCLICIFLRLMRTSRAMELERSGAITRSINHSSQPSSRSFRSESNMRGSSVAGGQQDPYGIFEVEGSLPRDIGPYKNCVKFTSNSLDVRTISSSLPLLKRLRVLLSSLQGLELAGLTHQQKLAFWINIYNACVMHGFLQYGLPSSEEKLLKLMERAALSIGGKKLNALAIEHFILRQPMSAAKQVYCRIETNHKEDVSNSDYGLEHPEANVMFSLSYGCKSSPAVRIYTADGVTGELERSKQEYLQASIVVSRSRRVMIPELLLWNMPNFETDMDLLLEWLCNQLPTSGSLRKSMVECLRIPNTTTAKSTAPSNPTIEIIPFHFEFQYLLPSNP